MENAINKFKKAELDNFRKDYRLTKPMIAKIFIDKNKKFRIYYSFLILFPMFLKGDIDLTWNKVTSNK
jgi:hypothetical protein